jgi:hypothetical protein
MFTFTFGFASAFCAGGSSFDWSTLGVEMGGFSFLIGGNLAMSLLFVLV